MMMSLKPPNPIPINPSSSSSSPTNPFPFPAKSLSPHPKTPQKKLPLSLSQSQSQPNLSLSLTPNPSQDQALLSLLRQRKTDQAWSLYTQCLHLPSATCLSRLVSQLSYQNSTDSLKKAQSIISRLRRDRHLSRLDSNSLGLLAAAAARSGHVRYAAAILKSMLRSGHLPHLKSWSAVVSRLSKLPETEGPAEALRLFRTVCRRISKLDDRELAGDSKPDTAAFNAALNAAANSGDFESFRELFDEMPKWVCEPDALSYNVMIKLAAKLGKVEALPKIVEEILVKDCKGGSFFCVTTIHSLVAAYVGFGDLEMAERIVQGMREGRRDILEIIGRRDFGGCDDEDGDMFEKMLSVRREGEKGDYLLHKSYPADSRMYTTLMKGYMRMGRVTDTVRMLEAMRCQGGEAGRPDEVSYTTVVTALANAGSMERARQVVSEMNRLGVAANRVTYNALLKGHCKRLEIQEAKEILREMSHGGPEPDVISYNIVIDGCVSVDDTASALSLFNEMRAKGIAPSKVSYTTLMKAFSVSGQPKLAHKVFDEMLNDPRIKADIVAWNVLVQGYCRLGFVDDAKRIIEMMKEGGLSPNVATYGSLANGIALARKPGEALLLWSEVKERCSEKTLKPDEGLLDALADICVRSAFFKKALEIVVCMEENGIAPNKTKYTRIYVEMHSRMFTSKHASQARQDRRKERKRAAEAFKFWLGLPNSYYGSEWRLEPGNDYASD